MEVDFELPGAPVSEFTQRVFDASGPKPGQSIDRVKEYLKCKIAPLYFIENYITIQVPGGKIPIKESELWFSTPKYRQFITALHNLDAVELLASRQHGKTQTALMYMLWAMLFYPNLQIEFVTLDSKRAADAIKRMKFMLGELPDWLKIPFKGTAERVTYMELQNGSRINSNYVSGSIDPDKLGRGLSAPILYLDEIAFVPKAETVWAAMQPAISAARIHAKKNNYPSLVLFTTTPNGAGANFFYNVWNRGWDYEEIFIEDTIKIKDDYQEILDSDSEKNNFVKFRIHWSETGKDEKWYNQQVRELNFDMRKINQEINIVFLGSSNAVFPDDVLEKFEPASPVSEVTMAYGESFKLTRELDPKKTYLLGVDTAATRNRTSDWSALFLMDAQTGEEVGSWHGKFSVIKRYAVVVKSLIQGLNTLHGLDEDTLIVVIERNSFGLGVVEELLYDDDTFDYASYVYYETQKSGERIPGLTTNASSRDMMFNLLLSTINEMPTRATSGLYQEELRNLEQKNSGRFEASAGAKDDVIMAGNFCLYVRNQMIQDGTVVTDGRINKFDIKRASYFLDVTMSNDKAIDKIIKSKDEMIEVEYHDEKSDRKRILKEMGLPDKYEGMETIDDAVIFGSGIIAL